MITLCRPILLAALLAGCSTGSTIWQRPNGTAEQTRADEAVCLSRDPARRSDERTSDGRRTAGTAGTDIRARQGQIDTCMEGLGYQLDRANAAEPAR